MKIVGIKYICQFLGSTGYAQAARGNILALHKSGIPITIYSSPSHRKEEDEALLDNEERMLLGLLDKNIKYNIVIIHSLPSFFSSLKEDGKFNIGQTTSETTKLYPKYVDYINDNLQAVMVPCDWNVDVFRESGVKIPVLSIPYCIDVDGYSKFENKYKINGIDEHTYKFYCVAEFNGRKNFAELILSYLAAFQNNENVALILKTCCKNEMEHKAALNQLSYVRNSISLDNYAKIYLIVDILDREEIICLHKFCDCYVSLNRGEGWGLTEFDAGCVGNPIIVTGFGGIKTFCNEDNSFLLKYTLMPATAYKILDCYIGTSMWAAPDLEHAINIMKYVYNNREKAKEKAVIMKDYLKNKFNWDRSVQKFISSIEKL